SLHHFHFFPTRRSSDLNFVIVYPSVTLANGRKSIQFMRDVGKVTLSNGDTIYGASSSIIGAQIIVMLQKEAPWLVGGTLVMIFRSEEHTSELQSRFALV